MPLHLLKLCVGAESIDDLRSWIDDRLDEMRARGETPEQRHTTRMVPKRVDALVDGGSLYWVIRGEIAVRQRLLAVRPFTDEAGIGRCHLVLQPELVELDARPHRPFQGWRYLTAAQAPPDASTWRPDIAVLPERLRRDLRELGLI